MKNMKNIHLKLIFASILLSVLAALSQAEPHSEVNGEMEALSTLRAEYLDQRSYWRNYHDSHCKTNFETDICRTARGVAEIYDNLADKVGEDVKTNKKKRRRGVFRLPFFNRSEPIRSAAADSSAAEEAQP